MKIAISGADGFLGGYLLDCLSQTADVEVVAITLFPDVVKNRHSGWSALKIVYADVDELSISEKLDEVDVYMACAFPRAAGSEHMAKGLSFVYDALGILLDRGCKAVINISSQSIYDSRRTMSAKETDSPILFGEYAVAKYCVELYVAQACVRAGVPYSNIRMASLIGPGFNQRFVNKMVKAAIETGRIEVIDNGSRFGFLDVRDAADGLTHFAMFNSLKWGSVYNLGPIQAYSTKEIADIVAAVALETLDKKVIVQTEKTDENGKSSEIDSDEFDALLGWTPSFDMYDSVRAIMQSIVCTETMESV